MHNTPHTTRDITHLSITDPISFPPLSRGNPNGKVPLRLMRSVGWIMEETFRMGKAKISQCHVHPHLVCPAALFLVSSRHCIHLGSRL